MSSSSPGRYQSRLFNFIHQQSRRVTEQCQRALRHVQVATSSAAPVVLYPLYLLFHSAQEGVKQLRQATQTSRLRSPLDDTSSQFQSPTADLPIQQVLLLVDNLPLEEREQTDLLIGHNNDLKPLNSFIKEWNRVASLFKPLALNKRYSHSTTPPVSYSRPSIRGIATQLLSRTLVLVTAQNEILDILTPQQQEKLQERIIKEVAQYWRHQRLAHQREIRGEGVGSRKKLRTSLVSTGKPQLSGVETEEKHLNETLGAKYLKPPSISQTQVQSFPFPFSLFLLLDRSLAELETKHLVPVLEAVMTLGNSQGIIQQVEGTPDFTSEDCFDFVKNQLQPHSNKSPATADGSENQTFRIQALIRAAIDYFFGHRSRKQLDQTTPTPDSWKLVTDSKLIRTFLPSPDRTAEKFSPPPHLVSSDLALWLTMNDLFGEPEQKDKYLQQRPESSKRTSRLLGKKSLTLPCGKLALPFLPRPRKTAKTAATLTSSLTASVSTPSSVSALEAKSVEESSQPRSHIWQEPATEWIDINATAVGYVKHPLEQLLEWLDGIMLWLEEVLMIVWRWMRFFIR